MDMLEKCEAPASDAPLMLRLYTQLGVLLWPGDEQSLSQSNTQPQSLSADSSSLSDVVILVLCY